MQIAVARADRPLVGGERRELTGCVVSDGRRDDLRPDVPTEVRVWIRARLDTADVLGVVRHREEIERGPELNLDASQVRNRLAFCVAVGIVRRARRAERRGVVRVARMQMEVAEVDVLRHGRALSREPSHEQGHRPQLRSDSHHALSLPVDDNGLVSSRTGKVISSETATMSHASGRPPSM